MSRGPLRSLSVLTLAAAALALGSLARAPAAGVAMESRPRAAAPTPEQWGAVQASVTLLTSRSSRAFLFADGFESGGTSRWTTP